MSLLYCFHYKLTQALDIKFYTPATNIADTYIPVITSCPVYLIEGYENQQLICISTLFTLLSLFNILKTRKIPEYLIGILSYWYSNQKYAVRWGNAISSYFEISNGIRQGGILSPILYNLYTDSLSTQLLSSRIGFHFAGECVNHIVYAEIWFYSHLP